MTVTTARTPRRSPRPASAGSPAASRLNLPEQLTAAPSDAPAHHVRVALDTRLRALLSHDPGARTGEDIEHVHQMRVSVRRMRAALKAARPLLDAEWSDALRAELGWLGRSLGQVRDLDVMLPRLRGLCADLSEPQRVAADQLIGVLDGDYALARTEMLTALNAPRYSTLLERLADATRLPLPGRSATDARPELVDLVRAEYRSLRKAVKRAGENPPDEVLHALRIKCKRLRYTGELVEPALGAPVKRLLQATTGLQEVLGDHQDACVSQQTIQELLPRLAAQPGDASPDPLVPFVAGRMAEREYVRAEYQRSLWWEAWLTVQARAKKL